MHKFFMRFFPRLNALKSWKRRKSKRPMTSDVSWLASSFATMEVSNQLKQVFRFFDSNGDGKISPVELGNVLSSLGHEKSVAAKEAEGMVREMDFNGDGYIDLDEFMSIMDAENGSLAKEEEEEDLLMDVFRVFDSDKNGLISAEELYQVLKGLGCDNCGVRECRRMIKGIDRDGDGFVNFEEFKLMMNGGSVR